ncbi:MAG: energy-coupling factor ABC transporter ATP-binding protein [Candidatus Methanofastidiosia archaeon]
MKAVEVENLSFSYPDGTKALKSMNLEIEEGEGIALVGPNGAGKSTLLLHFNGILIGKGTVKIFGIEVKHENLRKVRNLVGLVFQDPNDQLFMPTVFDDVAFGPLNLGLSKEEVLKRVDEALRAVEMEDFKKRASHHLSFGEKKKLSLATVLSMNPKLLVLDEPSGNLDPRGRRNLLKILGGLNLTKLLATHDLNFASKVCERCVILNGGKVVYDGGFSTLRKEDLRYYGL